MSQVTRAEAHLVSEHRALIEEEEQNFAQEKVRVKFILGSAVPPLVV